MAGKKRDMRDEEINRAFEAQQRRLNRRRLRSVIGGLILLGAILFALQFTPLRDIPGDMLRAAKGLVSSFTSGSSAPKEPDPQYW